MLEHRTTAVLWLLGTEQVEQMQNLSLDAMIQLPGHLYIQLKLELISKQEYQQWWWWQKL
jgi:hypothetical protein